MKMGKGEGLHTSLLVAQQRWPRLGMLRRRNAAALQPWRSWAGVGLFSLAAAGASSVSFVSRETELKRTSVTIQPQPRDLKITFNISDPKSWHSYVNDLQHFLSAYNESVQEKVNQNCTSGNYTFQGGYGPNSKFACRFIRNTLDNCSGLEDPTFGYKAGQPCILIRMNRIINYLPGNGTAPYVTCAVLHAYPENIGKVVFYPENGTFDLSYFPYYGRQPQPTYINPLVAVKFLTLKRNRIFEIQCKINAPGMINDNPYERFEGRVIFTLDIKK
ncbi:protein ATP1B4-like isoform X4 [Mobula hypostoma]|uniref:protein ATP1B4-like isoform X4 n=1 Tax=Mobula hypostoma TaxID=723540 RepID=UPI002FC3894D